MPIWYIFVLLPALTSAHIQQSYTDLKHRILSCPAIEHKLPPELAGTGAVDLYFEPVQISTVDELRQSVKISAMLALFWQYPDCAWDPANYSGISFMNLKSSDMWHPSLVMPKTTEGKTVLEMPQRIMVTSDGFMMAQLPDRYDTACYLDLLYYPFDQHNCTVPFLDLRGFSLNWRSSSPLPTNLARYFSTSAEWKLQRHGCGEITLVNGINYTECWFTMKRRSIFYIATVIFPVAAMCITTFLVFCIPAESGEKMSFLISLFVSMTVFMNFIVDVIPRSMDQLPKLVWLIMAVWIIIGAVTAVTALILRRYHQEVGETTTRAFTEGKHDFENDSLLSPVINAMTKSQTRTSYPFAVADSKNNSSATTNSSATFTGDDVSMDTTHSHHINGTFMKDHSNPVGDAEQESKLTENRSETPTTKKTWRIFYRLNHRQLDLIGFVIFVSSSVIAVMIILLFPK